MIISLISTNHRIGLGNRLFNIGVGHGGRREFEKLLCEREIGYVRSCVLPRRRPKKGGGGEKGGAG